MSELKPSYKDNFTEYLLCLALDVGEGMLKNGAEINRVEDTIFRICKAYGAVHIEVFSIISLINASIRMPDGSFSSQIRRVKSTSTDLSKLEALNALSRKICRETPELCEFDDMIHKLKNMRTYSLPTQIIASAITVGAFAVFFGGNTLDALIAAVIGVVISLVDNLPSKRFNPMAKTIFSSFFASFIAALAVKLGIGKSMEAIITGSIMLLVPGLAFGAAMRDLLGGDLLAGMLKTLQACISALMIAFGYLLAMSLIGGGAI